jgi:hypothetical protein
MLTCMSAGRLDKIEDDVRGRERPKGTGERTAHEVLAILRRVFSWYAIRNDDFRSPYRRPLRLIVGKVIVCGPRFSPTLGRGSGAKSNKLI